MQAKSFYKTIMFLIALTLFSSASWGQPLDKKQLQARFEKRYPQILQYKTQGKVGETMQGLLEVVNPKDSDPAMSKLVDEENSDRKALYELIAKDTNTTPDKVAAQTAQRNYSKARPGEYLKSADGKWQKKA